ncbi:MAG: cupin domain-containing protein [Spirochaetaceae bacterium]|nr:cupin domain-containing protein [Spirochaetaceae bacterium]
MSMQNKKTPFRFGEKLRTVRERKGYTLKIVAQQAGVSESLVSQIERNKVSPAIDTLLTLADVLDINLEYLFEEYRQKRPVQIIRAQERRTLEEEGILYEELAKPTEEGDKHSLESYLIKIPVNQKTLRGSYGHLGREMGFIIEGEAQLQYESKTYSLKQGDSVSFSASSPHTLVNTGSIPLKALWVVTPPQRFV